MYLIYQNLNLRCLSMLITFLCLKRNELKQIIYVSVFNAITLYFNNKETLFVRMLQCYCTNIPQYQCNNPFIILYHNFQSVTITFHHTSSNSCSSDACSTDAMSISTILLISRLLACKNQFYSEPLQFVPNIKENIWNAMSVKMEQS